MLHPGCFTHGSKSRMSSRCAFSGSSIGHGTWPLTLPFLSTVPSAGILPSLRRTHTVVQARPGRSPCFHADAGLTEHHPTLPLPGPETRPRRGHLLGVGAVPEDGVAVGHHFGTGLLAEYAHQQQHADEKDHFHLQHHYSATSARIPLRRRVKSSRVGRFNRDR